MKVKKRIDSAEEIMELKQFKNYVQSHSFIKSLVLGISEQDSTLVGKLVQMYLNELP